MSAQNDGAVLAFENLTVRYGKTKAVDGVSFSVGQGEVYALLGRNGSGKTSMIRCLLGQWAPTSGRAVLFGGDAWRTRTEAAVRLGVVPEAPDMPAALDANTLEAFCRKLYPKWDSRGVAERLQRFGVPLKIPYGRLSRGQKNQLALALALASMPEVLVLDDPTLGLDAVARKEFFEELVGDLADRGTTVFITTHDLAGIEGIATRVGILKAGVLLVDEAIESLKERFRIVRWEGNAQPASLGALAPVRSTGDTWGCEALVSRYSEEAFSRLAQDLAPTGVEASALSLEELFIALAGEEGGRS
jgi:ABC-2 type transport system ATP-binding protein